MPSDPNASLIVYTGFGYRSWRNRLEGPGGYQRQVDYLYLPFGVSMPLAVNQTSSIELIFEFDLLVRGTVHSRLSDVSSDITDALNEQAFASGFAFRGSAAYRIDIDRKTSLSIEPYFRVWNVSDSQTDTILIGGEQVQVYEPQNQTLEVGLGVSLHW